jgi:hypothetical protein
MRGLMLVMTFLGVAVAPTFATAQVSHPLTGAYIGLGDSVAAGTGAFPVTSGYVYRLYDRGVFGQRQDTGFSNVALRGARSWELRDHQVPQLLCTRPVQRPTVLTITAGTNDFFQGDFDASSIARRVAEAVNVLLNNPYLPSPVVDPATGAPCPALDHVTILVSNYYSIPHPDPAVFGLLDQLLRGFDAALRFWLSTVVVPQGSRVGVVDLYTASLGRTGLVMLERRNGDNGGFDFDPHPTTLGHELIAREFERAWTTLSGN